MQRIAAEALCEFATRIFEANQLPRDVASQVAESLVLANLSGHDSNGVVCNFKYVDWTKRGRVNPHGNK